MRHLFAVLLLLSGISSYAQTPDCKSIISAQVIEKHNLQVIYPATIHIDELQKDYDVNEDGKVVIRNICPGTYTVHVHAHGYEHYAEIVTVNGKANVQIRLIHIEHMLNEVSVTEARTGANLLQNKQQLDKDQIAANSGKTLSDMLQTVNGVTLLSTGGSIAKPVIHGMHSNRIVMLNNGVRQEDQQWGGEHAPNIDPFLANNITVVKGAAGVRYGTDAIGGVVLVEPAPLRSTPGWNGELNLAGFSNNRMGVASGMIEHNLKKIPALSIRLQGTYKKGGNYRTPNYWVANTGLQENNYSATVGWKKRHYSIEAFYSHFDTDLGVYRGSHTGNTKDLMAAIESKMPLVQSDFTYTIDRPMQHVTHDLVKTRVLVDTRIGDWSLTHAYQRNFRQEYDVVRIDRGNAQLNLSLNTQSLNLNYDHRQIGGFSGSAGIDGFYQENYFQPGDRLFIPNFRSLNGAVYAIERYRTDDWTFEGGLRYDVRNYEVFNPEGASQQVMRYDLSYNNFSGTVGIQYRMTPTWTIGTTLANAWRAPQPTELFSAGLHHSAARIELGNKTLVPEQSYNAGIEVKHDKEGVISFEANTYLQYIKNYIYLSPGQLIQTIRGAFKSFNYTQTNAMLFGIDASVVYHATKHLQVNLKASFVRAEDMTRKDWLILMPADRISGGLRYTQDISKRFKQSFAGLSARMVMKQQRIPGNFSEIDYPMPPDGYTVVDAELGTQIALGKQQPISLSITVQNLGNTVYRDYMDAFRYFIDRPGTDVVVRLRVPFNF